MTTNDDFSCNEKKNEARVHALNFLRESGINIWEGGANGDRRRFSGAACDLAGKTAEIVTLFEEEDVIGDDGLVLVDLKYAHVRANREAHPTYKFITGNLYDSWNKPEFDRVNIWIIDGYSEIGGPEIQNQARNIRSRMGKSVALTGEAALIHNASIDSVVRRQKDVGEEFWNHACRLAKALNGYLPRRVVEPEMLVKQDECGRLADPDFRGQLGRFFVYRSRIQRMANLEMILL